MTVRGFHGTERNIAKRLEFNHSWDGAESSNELGYGVYFYPEQENEDALYIAISYPMGKREDSSDAIWALTASWEDNPAFYVDLDDERASETADKLLKGLKERYNGDDQCILMNERRLRGLSVETYCKHLKKLGNNFHLIKKTINVTSSIFWPI